MHMLAIVAAICFRHATTSRDTPRHVMSRATIRCSGGLTLSCASTARTSGILTTSQFSVLCSLTLARMVGDADVSH